MPASFTVRAFLCALAACGLYGLAPACPAQTATPAGLDVHLVTDEAEAVLAILGKRRAGRPVAEADWARVFASEGYVRLKQRETSMKRPFGDDDFKTFVLSEQLAGRARLLEETLERWKRADVTSAARRALAYLPAGARIRAKIYPVIKPRENSFVFGLPDDPAIFLYLDPATGREKFENTLAHELHHVGYGGSCPPAQAAAEVGRLPPDAQTVLKWVGAFGEGFAVLAAAGGPDTHPHASSDPAERARWDRDVANFNDDLKKLETFFVNILEGRLSEEEVQNTASSFYGEQGPWYTVGWKMAALIEKTYGRAKLVEALCDRRKLLSTYNEAAAKHNRQSRAPLALWSATVVDRVGRGR